jgi:hypothetical protein
VRHRRHYTVAEASAQLPWLGERLAALRDASERLTDSEAREALAQGATGNGGGGPGKQVGEAFVELQSGLAELQQREIVLRDLERGLVDFPAVRDGEEVYLCWIDGEPEIGFWHELDAGYAGRRPLD